MHFVLDTDASNNSIAVVLSNLDSNTENTSSVLTRTELNYSITKKEAFAVASAVKWLRSYLLGISILCWTDHAKLDFKLVHRPVEKHGNACVFSRQTTGELEWQEGEEEVATGFWLMNLETAIAKLRETEVFLLSITEHSEENMATVELKASSDEG